MQTLRYWHRFVTIFIVIFTLFLGITGVLIQSVDLRSILFRYPANDANVMAMREAFDGPGDFIVRQSSDYTAQSLPSAFNYEAALGTVIRVARSVDGGGQPSYLEFRMVDGRPVGQIGVGPGHVRIDPKDGTVIEVTAADKQESQSPASIRNDFKHLHRMTTFGDYALIINLLVSVGLVVLLVTGTIIYYRLWKQRRKMKRPNLFWSAGGTWRTLHRAISITAALLLVVVTLSGAWLAVESAGLAIYMRTHPFKPGDRPPASAPIDLTVAPAMLRTALASTKSEAPQAPITALRLRNYGGYAQGVVITGGDDQQQLVFDTRDGSRMTLTEPGYPPVPFPFGWQAHQYAKSIHRGDFFGLTGRWLDLIAGLAMIYLSASGIEMYYSMWKRRKNTGRRQILWK